MPDINQKWCELIVHELMANCISRFCISPGSRSTPLTVAAARYRTARKEIFYDERGAGFYALGYARGDGRPAALICTSGTAAANYYPAVIEASMDGIPMIILTADRPHELRETGANQTIDQTDIFGNYVRWRFDMPCPDEKIDPEFVLTTIDQAVFRARGPHPGPVHLNCPFREPLAPSGGNDCPDFTRRADALMKKWFSYTRYDSGQRTAGFHGVSDVAKKIEKSERVWIAAGRLAREKDRHAVTSLALYCPGPLFADNLSGLRKKSQLNRVVPYYDLLLLSESFREEYLPETILHIGGRIVSKRFHQLIASGAVKNYIRVSDRPERSDPFHRASLHVHAGIVEFCDELKEKIPFRRASVYTKHIRRLSGRVELALSEYFQRETDVSEPGIAHAVSSIQPRVHGLFLASSMPVRDMDMYAAFSGRERYWAANRGASGIDGTIASAAGFATGRRRPVTVIAGDIAALHDCNSLSLLNNLKQQVTVVIINNGGGGIFSFLPIAAHADVFERYFGTPHDCTFGGIAESFGLPYFSPETMAAFEETYTNAICSGKPAVIEVKTDRNANRKIHTELEQLAREAVESQ